MVRFLALLLALLLPFPALAADNARITVFSSPTERVKLRAQPDDNARVLGQYYGGQPLEILEDGRKWHLVSIEGRTGYMMQRYITDLTETAQAPEAVIRFPQADGTLPLYDQAGTSGREIARMQGGQLWVLATVSEEWLHVSCLSPQGERLSGFASALCITWPGEQSLLQVKQNASNQKLHLRVKAAKTAESLGLYYPGTVVYSLLEDSPVRGWTKVRVGDNWGYMLSDQLAVPTGDIPLPTGRLRGETCAYYATADSAESAGTLFAAATFAVAAEQNGRCQIRMGAEEEGGVEWVWVDSADIQYGYVTVATPVPAASPTP